MDLIENDNEEENFISEGYLKVTQAAAVRYQ
jgi:hypothetical protein